VNNRKWDSMKGCLEDSEDDTDIITSLKGRNIQQNQNQSQIQLTFFLKSYYSMPIIGHRFFIINYCAAILIMDIVCECPSLLFTNNSNLPAFTTGGNVTL